MTAPTSAVQKLQKILANGEPFSNRISLVNNFLVAQPGFSNRISLVNNFLVAQPGSRFSPRSE